MAPLSDTHLWATFTGPTAWTGWSAKMMGNTLVLQGIGRSAYRKVSSFAIIPGFPLADAATLRCVRGRDAVADTYIVPSLLETCSLFQA